MTRKMPNTSKAMFGTTEPPQKVEVLRVGALSFELRGGNIGRISLGGTEVLRGISYLVRDENWGTCATRLGKITVQRSKGRLQLSFAAKASNGGSGLAYKARIVATADSLEFSASVTPNPKSRRICLAASDPRQFGTFAVTWNKGLILEAARAGVKRLTLGGLCGPRGLLDRQGKPTPSFAIWSRCKSSESENWRGADLQPEQWLGHPDTSAIEPEHASAQRQRQQFFRRSTIGCRGDPDLIQPRAAKTERGNMH